MEKKQAMKILKEFHDKSALFSVRTALDTVIPELKESEDERIRKGIIKYLEQSQFGEEPYQIDDDVVRNYITWLEKQGKEEYALKSFKDEDVHKFMQYIENEAKAYEFNLPNRGYDIYAFAKDLLAWLEKQCKNNIGISEATKKKLEDNLNKALEKETPESWNKFFEKQDEQKQDANLQINPSEYINDMGGNGCYLKTIIQKPDDEVKPKFKIGDWIISPGGCYLHILDIKKDGYLCEDVLGEKIKVLCEHSDCDFKSWTIQDAKDGDVLALEWKDECQWQKIVIFKSLNEFGVEGYGNTFKNNKLAFKADIPCYSKTWTKYLHPATKEQRDLLFQMMKEAGYKWDSVKKELKRIDNEWVNLGLPSGTLWKSTNEEGYYTYDEVVNTFSDQLPTKEQFEELKDNCTWEWKGHGYKVIGRNGNSIFLTALGYRDCNGYVSDVGSYGRYWSSTPYGSDHAWYLYFYSSKLCMYNYYRCGGLPVRLVKNK